MRTLFVSLLIMCSLTLSALAQSGESRYIEVNGNAYIDVNPDIVILYITLSSEDGATKDIDKAERTLYNIVNRVRLDAKENLSYNSLESDYVRRKSSDIQKRYRLKVTELEKISLLYNELSDQGISNIIVSEFKSSKKNEFLSDLRKEAVKSAKAKAEVLAEAAGVEICGVLTIIDRSYDANSYQNRELNSMMMKSFSQSDSIVNIDPTKLKFSVSVTVQWLINQK